MRAGETRNSLNACFVFELDPALDYLFVGVLISAVDVHWCGIVDIIVCLLLLLWCCLLVCRRCPSLSVLSGVWYGVVFYIFDEVFGCEYSFRGIYFPLWYFFSISVCQNQDIFLVFVFSSSV